MGVKLGGLHDFVGISESGDQLQRVIDVVHSYCRKWRLKANVTKSAVMTFGKGSVEAQVKMALRLYPIAFGRFALSRYIAVAIAVVQNYLRIRIYAIVRARMELDEKLASPKRQRRWDALHSKITRCIYPSVLPALSVTLHAPATAGRTFGPIRTR